MKLKFGASVVLIFLVLGQSSLAEPKEATTNKAEATPKKETAQAKSHASEAKSNESTRAAGQPTSAKPAETNQPTWKETYKKFKDGLSKIGEKIRVEKTAVPGHGEITETSFDFTASMRKKILDEKGIFDVISKYRESLVKCKDTDPSSKAIADALDKYVAHLYDTFGDKPNEKKDIKISEKWVNAYTHQIIRFLEKKAELFKDKKSTFEKADANLTKNLKSLAGILWGNEESKFREDVFKTEEAAKDEKTKKFVESMSKALKDMEHQATKTDKGTCKLDDATAPSDDTSDDEDDAENDDNDAAPPGSTSEERENQERENNNGNNGNTGNNGNGNNGAPQDPTGNNLTIPGGGSPIGSNLGENQDLQGALNFDALQNENDLLRDLLNRQDQEDQQNDQALLDALAAAQRPNNVRSAGDRSEQGPQFSPQIPGGSDSGQQPQIPPPPPLPEPQQGGIPPWMMMPQQQQQLPLELFKTTPKSDDENRRRPIPVQDQGSSAVLELLKIQTQMLQNMMGQGMNPYMNGVQNVGQRLQSFGGRMVRGNGIRNIGARLRGTATTGVQGRLQFSGARAPVPAAISGRR